MAAVWKQNDLLRLLETLKVGSLRSSTSGFITSIEFLHAVRIGRTKSDQLVQTNKVRVLQKGRKIYVLSGEVERYFNSNVLE